MRITVIILSSFAGLVLVLDATVPIRLAALTLSGERTPEVVGILALFVAWMVGTALVYSAPTLALPCFTLASFIGLSLGFSLPFRRLLVWGTIAGGLAVLDDPRAAGEAPRRSARRGNVSNRTRPCTWRCGASRRPFPSCWPACRLGDSGDVPTVTPPMPTSVPSGLVRGTRR